ncbi:MAG: hypothetical protein A3C71_02155 [Candidatus Yanofskybacteria bacterium RIFCSPHIGHO2_02_FULL_43_15c]|uniref:Pilus assembly protein PilO n=2 Tax=Candidatus Yanofskyibacteriota TaxID=1752733 RepID=A0A1F8H1D5_9BACT|nr:MAG: hypothetical protein A3C71_02155 [Candidatus Yanofskybacteria bacterium RIFCSPHIGHO2_02_FULL_43_15c]OGN30676.1 MAG: hypothetical protein A3I92_01305 [Candidatus Yanofskybacteria bacterium RIFCSPLOWO2_02_FULL_43_10b]
MNYKKLMGAGMGALGFILFAVLVWPLFKGIGEIKVAIESKQTVLDQRTAVLDKVRGLKKNVSTKQSEIEQLGVILPSNKKLQDIVVNVEEASRQSGISLRELKTSKVLSQDPGSPYQVIQVELSGSGFYQSVVDLFKSLEKNLRIFDVQEFTISVDSAEEATGLLNLELKFYAYYLNG